METSKLFAPAKLGKLDLANHIVMSPMTRNRATPDHIPVSIMAEMYRQRASVGLIVTEDTSPSANGSGYARIPGIYNQAQIDAWKEVTASVHNAGGKIFLQLMHTGRVSHALNMEPGTEIIAPSAIAPVGEQIYTDQKGMVDYVAPRELTTVEVRAVVQEYATAAKNAMAAGFDGIELHEANGYLIEQFLRPTTNKRSDEYGGSKENLARFALEVAKATIEAIGADKVGIRLSPYGTFNNQPYQPSYDATYKYLAAELTKLGIVYLHLVNHSDMGAPKVDQAFVGRIRKAFPATLILSGGYDKTRAEKDLDGGLADLIAFGRPILSNPDFVERIKTDEELNVPDMATFYTPGAKGYTDYPTLAEVAAV